MFICSPNTRLTDIEKPFFEGKHKNYASATTLRGLHTTEPPLHDANMRFI